MRRICLPRTIASLFVVLAAGLKPIFAQAPDYPPSNPPPPNLEERLEKAGHLLVLDCNGTGKQFVILAPHSEPSPVNFKRIIKVDLVNGEVELPGGEIDDAEIDNETISFKSIGKTSGHSMKIDRRTGSFKTTEKDDFTVSSVEGTCDNISGRRKF